MTWDFGPLVDADWLAEHLGDPKLRVLEATVHLTPKDGGYDVRSGREDWEAGHIPGSAFADLVGDLSEPDASLNFTFPAPGRFAAAMSALGVEDGTAVAVYDRTTTMWATLINTLAPGAFAAARIPGSTNLPSRDLLDPDSGRFRSPDELRERLGAAGALGGGRVVTYCGGGISATLDAFALTLVGEPDVAVYDGSMGEWTADPALPIERG
jgi:thiosulfate/3-mercaptopyruvate sulfurtransferase